MNEQNNSRRMMALRNNAPPVPLATKGSQTSCPGTIRGRRTPGREDPGFRHDARSRDFRAPTSATARAINPFCDTLPGETVADAVRSQSEPGSARPWMGQGWGRAPKPRKTAIRRWPRDGGEARPGAWRRKRLHKPPSRETLRRPYDRTRVRLQQWFRAISRLAITRARQAALADRVPV